MEPPSPTLASRELGFRLQEARDLAGMTGVQAAKSIGITQNYLSNVEHGRRRIAEEKLTKLSATYALGQREIEELLVLRRAADASGWWLRYSGHFSPELLRLFGYEHGAEEIKSFENGRVPGLLQTEDYARALHSADNVSLRLIEVERRVAVRLRRQGRLRDEDPLRLVVVVGESALWQQVGGKDVLADQLRHMINLIDETENLELRVLPFSCGSCGALGSATFHVLSFPNPRLPPVAWEETSVSLELVDDKPRVRQYELLFNEALSCAADLEDSKQLITTALKAIT